MVKSFDNWLNLGGLIMIFSIIKYVHTDLKDRLETKESKKNAESTYKLIETKLNLTHQLIDEKFKIIESILKNG